MQERFTILGKVLAVFVLAVVPAATAEPAGALNDAGDESPAVYLNAAELSDGWRDVTGALKNANRAKLDAYAELLRIDRPRAAVQMICLAIMKTVPEGAIIGVAHVVRDHEDDPAEWRNMYLRQLTARYRATDWLKIDDRSFGLDGRPAFDLTTSKNGISRIDRAVFDRHGMIFVSFQGKVGSRELLRYFRSGVETIGFGFPEKPARAGTDFWLFSAGGAFFLFLIYVGMEKIVKRSG